MTRKKIIGQLALTVATALGASMAQGQTTSAWVPTTGGDFFAADNWNGGVPDTDTQIAQFNTGSSGQTVTFASGGAASYGLDIQNDNVTLDLGGNTYTLSTSLTAGDSADGSVTLENGTVASSSIVAGFTAGTTGTITVGNNATLTAGSLDVGFASGSDPDAPSGNGNVYVNAGGTLNTSSVSSIGYSDSSNANVTVSGSGATWNSNFVIQIGGEGDAGTLGVGSLNVLDGAVVNNTGYVVIQAGSSAAVDNATWYNNADSNPDDGYGSIEDNGSLTISNGGLVTHSSFSVENGATLTVTGAGSQFNQTADSYTNDVTGGMLNIEDGGSVSVIDSTYIVGNGQVNISGGTWNGGSDTVDVGLSGQGVGSLSISGDSSVTIGTLDVYNASGASVSFSGGTLNVGTLNSNSSRFTWTGGTLNITGSTLTIGSGGALGSSLTLGSGMTLGTSGSGKISLGSNSTLTINGGTFASTATFGTISTSATIDIDSGSSFARTANQSIAAKLINDGTVNGPASGQLTLTGTSISGVGSYTGNITFNGTFSPGDSGPAAIDLTGAAVSFGSSDNLEMDLDSTTAGTGYDQLKFGSSAAFGGKLTISLDNGFTPANGDSFNLFTGGTSGSFSTVTLPTLALGLAWNTSELYSNGILSIGAANQWVSPGANGNFSDTTKWTSGTVPGTTAQALFNTSSTSGYTVSFTAATTNDNAVIGNDTLTFDLHGNTYTLGDTSTTTPSLLVGVSGTGNLMLQSTGAAGTLATQYAMLGEASGASGTVNINDPNVTWTVAKNLYLGGSNSASGGTGVLNLSNGNVTVTGTLEAWNTNSAINLSGGTLSVGTLTLSNLSELNWKGGTLNFTNTSGLTISSTGPLGAAPIIGSSMTLEVSNASAIFTVNTGSSNTFTINGGSVSDSNAYIGYNSGSAGTAAVEGAGSTWTSSGDMLLGAASGSSVSTNTTGTLNITNGGVVSDAVGELGELGANKSGGAVTSGTVTVDGAGSTWTNSSVIEIGGGGVGTLTISDGGSVTNTTAYLGDATTKNGGYTYYSSGAATVGSTTSTPSTWTTTGNMYVGGNGSSDAGSGAVTINTGGVVNVDGTLTIYKPANSSTTATVNLAGGTLNAGALNTSSTPANFNWTAGTLNITNSTLHIGAASSSAPLGSNVSLNSNMNLLVSNSADSLILDSSSMLTNAGFIKAANMNITAGTYTSTGTTEIDGGTFTGGSQTVGGDFINHGSVDGPAGGYLTFSGDVSGDGSFTNVDFAGSFTPDDPVISDLDNVTFDSTNTLNMDIEAATTPGAGYDQVDFAGSDTLGGTLDIQFIDSFIPAAGDSFTIFDFGAASITGTFNDLDLPTLSGGLKWNTAQLYTTGDLSITSSVPLPAAGLGGIMLLIPLALRRRSMLRRVSNC